MVNKLSCYQWLRFTILLWRISLSFYTDLEEKIVIIAREGAKPGLASARGV